MHLHELTDEWLQLQTMLEEASDDDDLQVFFDTMEGVAGEFDEKIAGCIAVYKGLMADVEALNLEADKLKTRASVEQNKADRLKSYVMTCMKAVGRAKSGDAINCASIVKNGGKKPVILSDEVPQEWQKVKYEPDNKRIREALENGEELPFAKLGERGERLSIK